MERFTFFPFIAALKSSSADAAALTFALSLNDNGAGIATSNN